MAKPVFASRSSTISSVTYTGKETVREIEFRSGNTYRYYNVPFSLWKDFRLHIKDNGSAGWFFNAYIKNRFAFEKPDKF